MTENIEISSWHVSTWQSISNYAIIDDILSTQSRKFNIFKSIVKNRDEKTHYFNTGYNAGKWWNTTTFEECKFLIFALFFLEKRFHSSQSLVYSENSTKPCLKYLYQIQKLTINNLTKYDSFMNGDDHLRTLKNSKYQ
jgi:hypothetical protein